MVFVIGLSAVALSMDESAFLALCLLAISWYVQVAAACRKCHDIGWSGWMQLIPLIALYLLFAPGDREANQYGDPPE